MGIGLAHGAPAVGVRRLGALVAGDHPGRHTQRPHDHHKRGGEMLTKALAPVEPELVDGVDAVAAGLQGVDKLGLADVGHQRGGQSAGIGRAQPVGHLACPGHGAAVEAGWQGAGGQQLGLIGQHAVGKTRPGLGLQAQPLAHQPVGVPLQVRPQPQRPVGELWCAARAVGRGLQQRQQGQADGFEQHLVAHRRAAGLQVAAAAGWLGGWLGRWQAGCVGGDAAGCSAVCSAG